MGVGAGNARPKWRLVALLMVLAITLMTSACGKSAQAPPSAAGPADIGQADQSSPMSPLSPDQARQTQGVEAGAPDSHLISSTTTVAGIERKVIYTSQLSLQVEDLDRFHERLEERLQALGGYLAQASISGQERGRRQGSFSLRVPAAQFEPLLTEIKNLGTVERENRSANDVTQEYIDLDARLANLKRQEERLAEILKQARNVNEVLQVEKELGRTRGEIESLSGRLKYLKNQIDFSTVNINATETGPAPTQIAASGWSHMGGKLAGALTQNLTRLLNGLAAALVLFFAALPYLLLAGLVLGAGWYWLRRWLRRSKPEA